MRKKLVLIIASVLVLSILLSGCGNSAEGDKNQVTGDLTKSEWVGLLGEKFGFNDYESAEDIFDDVKADDDYYNEIQACAEWEILQEEGSFAPKEKVNWQYAIETCVRAIGIDKLNQSESSMTVSEDNLIEFFTSEIAKVEEDALDRTLNVAEAEQMLEYVYDYAMKLSLAEHYEYTYNEDVSEVSSEDITLMGDGVTAQINNGTSYKTGDIIYVTPSDESAAYAVKVDSVNGDEINYTLAGMEDVYEELYVTGTFDARIVNVIPAEGVTISIPTEEEIGTDTASLRKIMEQEGKTWKSEGIREGIMDASSSTLKNSLGIEGDDFKMSSGPDGLRFSATPVEGASVSVDITDIQVTADVDYGLFKGLQKADITVNFDDKVKASYAFSEHQAKQINLGRVDVVLGPTPLTARFAIVLNFGVDGEMTVTYTSTVIGNANYVKGRGLAKSVSNENAVFDFHAEVTITVEPAIKVEITCLGGALANIKVYSGVIGAAEVDADLLGDEPFCVDLKIWVPLRWAVNEDWCLITAISSKLKASDTVWGEENSPIQKKFHWENGELVEECTRGKDKVEIEIEEIEGEYFEYAYFDFEEIVFGVIEVSSQTLRLLPGESLRIGILTVPGEQDKGGLKYTVENESVCSVNGGIVTAKSIGTTLVKVSTSDEKISVYVSVVVEEEYHDTSEFRPL